MYHISFYVPKTHLEVVKEAMFGAGAGRIGHYSKCAWQIKGEGQFCPQVGSDPYLGEHGEVERVEEYKVEMVCCTRSLSRVIEAMKSAHPYEEVAYSVFSLESV